MFLKKPSNVLRPRAVLHVPAVQWDQRCVLVKSSRASRRVGVGRASGHHDCRRIPMIDDTSRAPETEKERQRERKRESVGAPARVGENVHKRAVTRGQEKKSVTSDSDVVTGTVYSNV